MLDIEGAFERAKEFYTGERKAAAWTVSALVAMLVAAIVALVVASARPRSAAALVPERTLDMGEELIVPPGPESEGGYITARKTGGKWGGDDVEKWLTVPSTKELEDLSRANDRIIDEITGAAP